MLSYEYRLFLNEKILDYLPLQKWRHNDKWNFKCPICGDGKTGHKHRAWWYDGTSSFYCWNCGTGMSGIKFLETVSGQDYQEIKREYLKIFTKGNISFSLSSLFELPKEETSIFDLKPIVKSEWKNPLSPIAKKYLDDRLVSSAPFFTGELYSWSNPKNKNEYILIPWTINGIDAYFLLNDFLRLGSMKYIFPKDNKKLVCGLDNIDISWPWIIVFEGFYDSLFVKNGICVGTKAITEYQLKIIRLRFPHHKIAISFDNDDSGIQSMVKLIQKDTNDFRFFRWFNKNTTLKDINDYVISKNDVNIFTRPEVLEKMIVSKLSMKLWLIQNGYWKS